MFRYVLPVILVGGKSSRMGKPKQYIFFKSYSFLDHSLNLLFDIGFSFVFLSGLCFGYSYVSDVLIDVGPISSFHGIFLDQYFKFFFHFFFVSTDMPFLSKSLIYYLIFYSYRNFSYYYSLSFFPFLFSTFSNIMYFFHICKYKKISMYFFLKFIFSRPYFVLFFYKREFLNVNTFFDLFLKK